jgi:hypothetical protein
MKTETIIKAQVSDLRLIERSEMEKANIVSFYMQTTTTKRPNLI